MPTSGGDWEQEVVIKITPSGAANANRALKEVTRSYKELQRLTVNPLGVKLGQSSFADAFNAPKIQKTKDLLIGAAQAVRVFRTLLIATGIEKFVEGIVTITDSLTNLQNKLRVVTSSNEMASAVFSNVAEVAIKTRSSLDSVATVYSRTARSVQDLGYSQAETLRFTETLSKAIMVGGSTSVEATNAMIQLSQGMASGTLKGDELRSVLEQLPVVSKLIADQMKVPVGRLRELGMQGKLTVNQVFDAIIKGTNEIDAKFSTMTPTWAQGWETFATKATEAAEVLQPLVGSMAEGIIKLGDAFKYVSTWVKLVVEGWEVLEKKWRESPFRMDLDKGADKQLKTITRADRGFGAAFGMPDEEVPNPGGFFDAQKKIIEDRIKKDKEWADFMLWRDPRDDALPKKIPEATKKKTGREGGLTFEELMFKMQQENEVAGMEPFNQGVAKEFFSKMGELKKSVRESMTTNAGQDTKAGHAADEQLRALQEIISAEHTRQSDLRIQYQLEDELYQMEQEQKERSIELGKEEEKLRAQNTMKIYESDRAIRASLDPFADYNKEIEKFNDFLARNPELADKVVGSVEKMGYMYQTFQPMFKNMTDSIADAAANAIIFGDNMHNALMRIASDLASQGLSSIFKMGISALLGEAMPGVNGGTPVVVPPAPVANAARGGYMPGYEYGGYTGSYARGDVAGVVHGREFVVNANATARNRAMLESMNSGRPVSTPKVTVNNYAGAQVETAMNDDGDLEIRINRAVAAQAPRVIAADMRNPNSRTSKALKQNYELARRN